MSSMFRAVRVREFGAPDVLKVEEVEAPSLEAGQILVDIKAAGVNPVETYIRTGTHSMKPPLPYTPGSDGAGIVSAVGEGVESPKVGERVFLTGSLSGTYAERALCRASQARSLPESLTFEEGAAIFVPFYSAFQALIHRGDAKAGETVLVHGGSGGVGIPTIQLALLRGMTVIATAGTEEGLGLLRRLGVHLALNHRDADYLDQLRAFVAPKRGVDVIIEMLANVNLANDVQILNARGRVVVVGSRGKVEIDARHLMTVSADVRGMQLYGATEQEFETMHREIGELLAAGSIKPIVGKRFTLSEAPLAHDYIINPPSGATGKVVLIP